MPTRGRQPADARPERPDRPDAVRLQRLLADAGVASRRECESLIESGRVEVNGEIADHLPVFVDPSRDRVSVDGKPVYIRPRNRSRVYVMLNKPERTLTTTRDGSAVEGNPRRTVLDLVQHPSGARLYPVGRLDYHSTGLVLLTDDGELTQRLTHARYGVPQTYRVWIAGAVGDATLDMLRRRVAKKGEPGEDGSAEDGVRVAVRPGDDRPSGDVSSGTVLEITLREGKRENIADMLLATGCKVRKMVRVAIGPLRLRAVPVGGWRDLFPDEADELRRCAGLAAVPTRRTVAHGGSGRRRSRRGSAPGQSGPKP